MQQAQRQDRRASPRRRDEGEKLRLAGAVPVIQTPDEMATFSRRRHQAQWRGHQGRQHQARVVRRQPAGGRSLNGTAPSCASATALRREDCIRRLRARLAQRSVRLAPVHRRVSPKPQAWPDKPVKVIVPYAAGGATDAIARPWARSLSKAFGQQFVIENRGGASGMIGVEAVVKAAPDGYTLIMTPNAPLTVLPSLQEDALRSRQGPRADRRARATCPTASSSIPRSASRRCKELVDYAKKNPGKLIYGSSGNGTANHLRLEALKLQGRHRHPARALSRRRRQPERRAARQHAHDERADHAAARQGRQAGAARHQRSRAQSRFSRRADADRGRHPGRRRADLVRLLRPGRAAEGDRRPRSTPRWSSWPRTTSSRRSSGPSTPSRRRRRRRRWPSTLEDDIQANLAIIKAANIKIE